MSGGGCGVCDQSSHEVLVVIGVVGDGGGSGELVRGGEVHVIAAAPEGCLLVLLPCALSPAFSQNSSP